MDDLLKGANMLEKILYVDIDYKDGLYRFENTDLFPGIPENIQVETPFFYEENSFDELVEILSEEEVPDVVFSCTRGNYPLIKELGNVLALDYNKQIYYVSREFKKEYRVRKDGNVIYLLRNYYQLNELESIPFEEIEEYDEIFAEQGIDADNGYFHAMKNGYVAFMTGIYPDSVPNTLAKHILVEDLDQLGSLNEYLDVNGAVLLKRETSDVPDVIQHIHFVNEEELCIDQNMAKVKRNICSYKQYTKLREEKKLQQDVIYFLKIESPEDLKCFAGDLERFATEGVLDTVEKRIVDECRWSGECSLKRVTRYEVVEGKVKPCLTSDVTLGDITTDADIQKIEANRLFDKNMIQRKCIKCSLRDVCSKCSCMATGMNAEEFCTFMHKHPYLREYLKKNQLAGFLKSFSKICEQDTQIHFSTSTKGLVYPEGSKEPEKAQMLFLFEKNGQYFYLNTSKANLIKIERKYAFLLEAWSMGESRERMVLNMRKVFQMTEECAINVVEEGMQRLKSGGMIG